MADIIPFSRKPNSDEYPTFTKVIDGVAFECVDVDALSPRLREKYFREMLAPGSDCSEGEDGSPIHN